jgi:hypothetical protein
MPATATPALTINQRNLYVYFLNHRKKHGKTPCFVPRIPCQNSRIDQYLTALVKLEQYGLIRVDRSTDNYTGWIMTEPKQSICT